MGTAAEDLGWSIHATLSAWCSRPFALQGPTSGRGAHSQGPPVGGDASLSEKAEHHHHIMYVLNGHVQPLLE